MTRPEGGPATCPECAGLGIKGRRPCAGCDGNGLLGLGIGRRGKEGGMATVREEAPAAVAAAEAPATNGAVKVYEYWKPKFVVSVREETLKGWREQLEAKVRAAREELAKLEGGLLQIDEEFARRARLAEEKERLVQGLRAAQKPQEKEVS